MSRFYKKRTSVDSEGIHYYVSVDGSSGNTVEIEVDEELIEELDDLQREFWRLERRESRHTVHMECIPDCYLPHDMFCVTPEDLLIKQLESIQLIQMLNEIPDTQRRRFLMRHLIGLSIKEIANIEGCSRRAIDYSLNLAKHNLRELLSECCRDY